MFRNFIKWETYDTMEVEVMIMFVGVKDIELERIHKVSRDLDFTLKAYIGAVETVLLLQKSLNYKQLTDLKKFFQSAEANSLAEAVSVMEKGKLLGETVLPVYVEEEVLDVKEVANLCGVSVQMVRRACESGVITAKRGKKRSWIISKSEFMNSDIYVRWMNANQDVWTNIEAASKVLGEDRGFIEGLKESEAGRKSDFED